MTRSVLQSPPSVRAESKATPERLLRLADRCVKCGFCLPHCPTYGVLAQEADSPRGRIALIQGWAGGHLDPTPTLQAHLDRCLGCRTCERVCPSLVDYGRLIDGAKAARLQRSSHARRLARRLRLALLADSRFMEWARRLAWLYGHSGAAGFAELLGLGSLRRLRPWHRLARTIPALGRRPVMVTCADPDLELFVGCAGALAQGGGVQAALALFRLLQVQVEIAPPPRCCGASARHNGLPEAADRLRSDCLGADAGIPLVGLASACVAELKEGDASRPVMELCDLLDRMSAPDRLPLAPVPATCLVHEPCSHRNLLGGNGAVLRLLERIPALKVRRMRQDLYCCGAAGTYMLDQPEMAQVLLDDHLAAIADCAPRYLVTTNPGCALHLAAGIREAGMDVRVCHPVELIWESARRGEHADDTPA